MSLDYKFKAKDIIDQGRTTVDHVEAISSWLIHQKEKCIPEVIPEELIVLFLLSCSNDVALAKHTVTSYYKLRKASPLLFENRRMDCPEIKLCLNTVSFCFISKPKDREIIHFYKLRDTYYKNAKIEYCLKVICMLLDVCQDESPPDSVTIVIDMEGCGFMHLTMIHLESLKTLCAYIQEACPVKTNTVHFVNSNLMLQKLLSVCKLFMKQGTMAKIYCHQSVKALSKYIPKEYLPSDYKGLQPTLEELRMDVVQKFKAKEKFWEEEERMRKACYLSK